MIRGAVLLAVVLASVAGCAPDLTALANDKNAICVTITTPWGTEKLDRNWGCAWPPPASALTISEPAKVP